jgi:hypothetical protein
MNCFRKECRRSVISLLFKLMKFFLNISTVSVCEMQRNLKNEKNSSTWFWIDVLKIAQRCFFIRSLQTIEIWDRWFLMIWASSSTTWWKWTRCKISRFFSYIFVHHSRLQSHQARWRANCMFRSNCDSIYIESRSCDKLDSEFFSNKIRSSHSHFACAKIIYRISL